jgi:predicted kinase
MIGGLLLKRLVIMTVGKTHSGKTTFAKELEQHLINSIVIDQDNHAEFVNTYYKSLRPLQGPNTIKYAITNTIVEYAVQMTEFHIILSNSNRNIKGRREQLTYFHDKDYESVLVHFDLPDYILQERVFTSQRSKSIFRTASNYVEVLNRQNTEFQQGNISDPREGEANYLFVIKDSTEVQSVIQSIVALRN